MKSSIRTVDFTLKKALAYEFNDETLLLTALTHRSASDKEISPPHGLNNERLEFLGDAVLSLVCANFLYQQNGFMSEGDLSRMRALYVCQENLSVAAKKLGLCDFIVSDKAMKASGSTNSKAILADALEAIIGAVFIDGGLKKAEEVIFTVLGTPSTKLSETEKDSKTKLQELIQASLHDAPKYIMLKASGPAHAPTFVVGVSVNNEILATAEGESKKSAAQHAAKRALEKLMTKSDVDQ